VGDDVSCAPAAAEFPALPPEDVLGEAAGGGAVVAVDPLVDVLALAEAAASAGADPPLAAAAAPVAFVAEAPAAASEAAAPLPPPSFWSAIIACNNIRNDS
jgi:hypothetical protein